jgi:hypothetical protein
VQLVHTSVSLRTSKFQWYVIHIPLALDECQIQRLELLVIWLLFYMLNMSILFSTDQFLQGIYCGNNHHTPSIMTLNTKIPIISIQHNYYFTYYQTYMNGVLTYLLTKKSFYSLLPLLLVEAGSLHVYLNTKRLNQLYYAFVGLRYPPSQPWH